ncbi:ribosomal protein S18-alanine N-acetyltransferase [Paucibacter sp. APW11]|uniref:[Ribosomal protein bS18]-alanine N-acetyltransferase n=1 Tax=Roseateles aquae TaxID=3077235 RepID=A0ABU3PAV0_9BURK|nr:ribosomal protein S18-alanine N-acetyltransferase [Paucibacter sp. APW11]MDT8999647.1 ribosomal protein S18-alanine N-acetyltransferase [Paucibacter sp. APW11]
MSATAPPLLQAQLRPLMPSDVDAVLAIELQAYEFPWTRGNFIDSIAGGQITMQLRAAGGELLGYFLAMKGYEELHLLNITVAPAWQGRGLARQMLDELSRIALQLGCAQIWLEVRQSNARARELYRRYGFAEVGLRRAYYPAAEGQREDAVLMSLHLQEARP